MNYKLYENGQIMKVISEGHEVATPYMNKEIHFSHNNNFKINQETPIVVNFVTFDLEQGKHVIDTSINKAADVEIEGVKFELQIVNGEGLIEFTSPNVGIHIIKVDGYRCEVIVDEN